MIGYWITHLAAHLAGGPLTTTVISIKGTVELKPVTIEEAKAHLEALLNAWHLGMRRPLPLAVKTAFTWLGTMANPEQPDGDPVAPTPGEAENPNSDKKITAPVSAFEKAGAAARKAYDGAYKQQGEVNTCAYLHRTYPDFNALSASGEFAELAETLLRPLQRAMPAKGKKTDKSVAPTESGAAT